MTSEEMKQVSGIFITIPWMQEKPKVKLESEPSRKQILILSQIVFQALERKKGDGFDLLSYLPEEADGIKQWINEYLEKAGIKDFAEKLKGFTGK